MRSLIPLAFILPTFAACSPYSPELPPVPFLCGPTEPRCPDGYTCMAGSSGGEYCLSPEGTIPVDAPFTICSNDSALEPNEDYMSAWPSPVADSMETLTLAGLSICEPTDKDTYSITITADIVSMQKNNLDVSVEYEDGGAALSASILNNTGTPIMNASPVNGKPRTILARAANLNAGVYYAQVYGPSMGVVRTNNYRMVITVHKSDE